MSAYVCLCVHSEFIHLFDCDETWENYLCAQARGGCGESEGKWDGWKVGAAAEGRAMLKITGTVDHIIVLRKLSS